MGAIAERLSELAKRCGDLSPLQEPVRAVLWEGNRERALAGTDAQGAAFKPLAPSTLKRRHGTGPPLAPQYASSRIVKEYVVQVTAGPGELRFLGSWPTVPWVEYHVVGGPHLPRRDPMGFRAKDLEEIRGMLLQYASAPRRSVGAFFRRAAAFF